MCVIYVKLNIVLNLINVLNPVLRFLCKLKLISVIVKKQKTFSLKWYISKFVMIAMQTHASKCFTAANGNSRGHNLENCRKALKITYFGKSESKYLKNLLIFQNQNVCLVAVDCKIYLGLC